jgi:hypothetical protein
MIILSSKIYAQSSLEILLKNLESGLESEVPAGEDGVSQVMQTILNFAIPLSAICAILILAFASYKLMMSKGDPDKLKDARDQISNAIIGFIFILVSAGILVIFTNLFAIIGITG